MAHVDDDVLNVITGQVTSVSKGSQTNQRTQELANLIVDARFTNYRVRHGMAESVADDVHSINAGQTSNEANRIISGLGGITEGGGEAGEEDEVILPDPELDPPEQTMINLGFALQYAAGATSTITNTGGTAITGKIFLTPGTSITGFPPGTVSGGMNIADSFAAQAKAAVLAAYNDAISRTLNEQVLAADIGSSTLIQGLYVNASSSGVTGTVTFDAQNNPNAVWIIRMGSTLTIANDAIVSLVNGAKASRIFWIVGSSATIGTNATFKGNVLCVASNTVNTGASVDGRFFSGSSAAGAGAVTFDTNAVTLPV